MKLRFPIALPAFASWLPRGGSRARLPFLLVPVLAAMAVVQLALPERTALPPGGSVARITLTALPDAPPPVLAPPLLASRDLFAPPVKRGGPEGASDPLGGAVIAGVVQQGRLRVGVVQQASGKVRYIGIGGVIAGWRLVALGQTDARLTHGPGQNLVVAYGQHPSPPTTPTSPQTSESGQ